MRRWRKWSALVGVAGVLVSGTGAAAAPLPDPVDAFPGAEPVTTGVIALVGDRLYAIGNQAGGMPLVYTRPVDGSPGATEAGAAAVVAHSSGYSVAVDGLGTAAFRRGPDGHVVLQADDGTQTAATWGAAEDLVRSGPLALSEGWLLSGSGTLYDRATGGATELIEPLTGMPPSTEDGPTFLVRSAVLQDSGLLIALWDMVSDQTPLWWVPLAGTVGVPVQLTEDGWATAVLGGRLVWQTPDPSGGAVLHSAPVGDPSGGAATRDLPAAYPLGNGSDAAAVSDGTSLVVGYTGASSLDLVRLDPTTLDEAGSADVTGRVWLAGATGDLVVTSGVGLQLSDPWGHSLTADQTAMTLPMVFSDSMNNPHWSRILWAAAQGLTTGYPDGTYRPTAAVTRGAAAAFFYRLEGEPAYTPPAQSAFSDLEPGDPFYSEVSWLADQGITTGRADGTFGPRDPVTRGAMAAFFYRYAGAPSYSPPTTSPFVDLSVGAQFYREICWLADAGITTGYSNGTYRRGTAVTRGAMATFLFRADDAGLRDHT